MSLIVQKYGGTSVADIESMMHVARKIKATQSAGHDVVVVVSAMGKETDRLESLAHQICETPSERELDVLLSTGEQVSIALLSIALQRLGCEAKSYTGFQAGIHTDSVHTKSRILHIDEEKIREDLANGLVVVVAGFQGIDCAGNITTFGRGGSDTTAVALGAALKADECQIYTDVDGVYTTDPHMVDDARKMKRVTFDEMLELSSLGAQVLQIRAVEFAGKYNIPLRVLSTFKEGPGTLITLDDKGMENPVMSGIAFTREQVKLMIKGVKDMPGMAGNIMGPLSDANIDVDMVSKSMTENDKADFIFTVDQRDYERAYALLKRINEELDAGGVSSDVKIAKISLVGVGMRSHSGIASTLFRVLGAEGINIQLITTTEIKVSVVVDENVLELGVKALHEAFGLHEEPVEENGTVQRLRA